MTSPPRTHPDAPRAKEILCDVLECPPEERARLIAERCSGSRGLRARVEALLAALGRWAEVFGSGECRSGD